MLSMYLKVIRVLTIEDIILRIKKAKENNNILLIFVYSGALLQKIKLIHRKVTHDTLTDLMLSLTRYLYVVDTVTMAGIHSSIDLELQSLRFTYYEEEGYAEFSTFSLSDNLDVNDVINFCPDRLKPLIYLYLDSGIILDMYLSLKDRIILYSYIKDLGGKSVNVDLDEVIKLIPEDMTSRILFLSILADNYPNVFILLSSTSDLSSLFNTCKLLGDDDSNIPTVETLVKTISDVSMTVSNFIESGYESEYSRGVLYQTLEKMDKLEAPVENLSEFYSGLMASQLNAYTSHIQLRAEKGDVLSFNFLSRELKNQMGILSKMKHISEGVF